MNSSYNIDIEGLFESLGLDELTSKPKALSGGHLNRVYSAETKRGKYAVKAINPQVIIRPSAIKNYMDSENIAFIASSVIPAVAAKLYSGSALQKYKDQYYLIYDFIEGECLVYDSLTTKHCAVMGGFLAGLHKTDFSSLGLKDDYSGIEKAVDWEYYLNKGNEIHAPWVKAFAERNKKLYEWNDRLINAASRLSYNTLISHGDLEPKNVIWKDENPAIIDWEAAGFVHPAYDLFENAIYWAKENDGSISESKFKAFFIAYIVKAALPDIDWEHVADKGFVMLGWLEYSLRRSLCMECADSEEQNMGTN
ncbi:MAG: phosphotransferase, partial [Eubacteriales bacterium]|nr:phosphotransferase [Eubacteriales bacterium]